MKKKLQNYFKASFPCIAIQTAEERRAIADVYAAAKATKKAIVTWSATEGLQQTFPDLTEFPESEDLIVAVRERVENAVLIFRDLEGWNLGRDPILSRAFRDMLSWAPTAGSCCVIIQPAFVPYPSIEKMVTVLDYALPDATALRNAARGIADSASITFDKFLEQEEEIVRALSGLSTAEAENALALSVIETKEISPAVIYREKVQQVRKTGLLEIIEPDPMGLDSIGGMEVVKEYILKRKRAFSKEAIKYGLPAPKGILAVGPPGTGKSALAKVVGTALDIPTLRMDLGALFNSLVGESEARTRAALQLAEAISPCVLWLDEVDKGLAGSSGSGAGDSGVSKRVFGTLLTWMQEKKAPVFVVMTANNVTNIDSAGFRKGRIDETYAIDLPNPEERQAIFKIHLKKRGRKELADNLSMEPNRATPTFTGSEIEAVVIDAMFNAFDEGREVTETDLVKAAASTVPLAKTAKEEISSIRDWARTRAKQATRKTVDTNQKRQLDTGAEKGGE